MKLAEAIRILKAETMPCFWPSKVMGWQGTDWIGIFGEVRAILIGIRERQGIPKDAMFYTLDEENPETHLYNQMVEAEQTVHACQRAC